MSIWAIADLHASRRDPDTGLPLKPMDQFGERWHDHMARLEQAWAATVMPEDTVVIAGDIDWALHLQDAIETLSRLDGWPGSKILLRGNHDFWWSSKTTNKVRQVLPASISLLHNDSLVRERWNICGTKGSPVPGAFEWTAEDEKLLNRETQRLELSLTNRDPSLPTMVALHYPPFYPNHDQSPFKNLLEANHVAVCVYGHLHGEAWSSAVQGTIDSVSYRLVSGDYLDFRPTIIVSEAG